MVTIEGAAELGDFCRNPPKGWQITYLAETPSTNIIGMEQGITGALPDSLVVADTQTKGRGRLGKEWDSYTGCGLYLSIVLRPKLALEHLSRITLAAGVALAETTAQFTRTQPRLKWPNDLLLNDQKCGGILAESDMRNISSPLVILGIGVNIHTPQEGYDPGLRVQAGSINDFSDGLVSRSDFLKRLIPAVQAAVKNLEEGQFQTILTKWRVYDYTNGKKLRWLTTGGEVVEGVCRGINDDGLLFIIDAGGITHQVLSGEIQLAEKMV